VKEAAPIWDGFLRSLTEGELEVLRNLCGDTPVLPCAEIESLRDSSLIYFDENAQKLRPFSTQFGKFTMAWPSSRTGKKAGGTSAGKTVEIPTGLFPLEILSGSRDYIVRIGQQVQGCYEGGFYDACAVMIRRLVETLIIECFEQHNIAAAAKGTDGEYLYLRDLISEFVNRNEWSISRNSKSALHQLKGIGDLSAHSRRFTARREDLNRVSNDLRVSVEELVHIAGFDRPPTRKS
jgi:hypothetical protein